LIGRKPDRALLAASGHSKTGIPCCGKRKPMLIEALRWWTERMAELIPVRLFRRDAGGADALIIEAGHGQAAPATVLLRRNRLEIPLGRVEQAAPDRQALRAVLDRHAKHRTVLLRPPQGALLEKQLTLPRAAERDIGRVIRYEMNRMTPFDADDVFWTWTVMQQDRSRGHVHVRLSLVPRAGLMPLLTALSQLGLSPTALEAAVAGGPPRRIPMHQETDRPGWRRRATPWLAGVCGALAALAAVLPFVLQSLALAALENRIAAMQPRVAEVQELRRRIAGANGGQDAIADAHLRFGTPLEVLSALTQLLPDDTSLNDLALRQRRLTITGQSAAAPKLIAGLASDPMFHNPGFSAPVTRNEAGRDVFSISVDVGP
jgi:general secretion pathway protein L